MNRNELKNVAASVHARLQNVRRETRRDFNLLLIHYALERFLYRLGQSRHRDRFVLKGALLFVAWGNAVERATRDLDLLSFGEPSISELEKVFREICKVRVDPDGLVFDASTVTGSEIREGAMYDGVRMKFLGRLGNARIPVQVDVGFGDSVVPPPALIEYPTLLDHGQPKILAYPPEAVIAEKFHAMVSLGLTNSRLKDYFDIWRLVETVNFDRSQVVAAVLGTFKRRRTEIPADDLEGLSREYALRWGSGWARISGRYELDDEPPALEDVIQRIREFVMPVLDAIEAGANLEERWTPDAGWRPVNEGG